MTEVDTLTKLTNIIIEQQKTINSIATKLAKMELSGGSASIEDYAVGKKYKRNTLIVDTATETVYRSLVAYISTAIEEDISKGYLKLVGYESQLVTFNHDPTQSEINALPDDTLVAVYSSSDTPYVPNME